MKWEYSRVKANFLKQRSHLSEKAKNLHFSRIDLTPLSALNQIKINAGGERRGIIVYCIQGVKSVPKAARSPCL